MKLVHASLLLSAAMLLLGGCTSTVGSVKAEAPPAEARTTVAPTMQDAGPRVAPEFPEGDWLHCPAQAACTTVTHGFRVEADGSFHGIGPSFGKRAATAPYCVDSPRGRHTGRWQMISPSRVALDGEVFQQTDRDRAALVLKDGTHISYRRMNPAQAIDKCLPPGASCAQDAECDPGLCSQGQCVPTPLEHRAPE